MTVSLSVIKEPKIEKGSADSMSIMKEQSDLLGEEEDETLSDMRRHDTLIDEYVRLQRIKTAPDRDGEIDFQIRVLKAKLKIYGVITKDLDI